MSELTAWMNSADLGIVETTFTPQNYDPHKSFGHTHWHVAGEIAADAKMWLGVHHNHLADDHTLGLADQDLCAAFPNGRLGKDGRTFWLWFCRHAEFFPLLGNTQNNRGVGGVSRQHRVRDWEERPWKPRRRRMRRRPKETAVSVVMRKGPGTAETKAFYVGKTDRFIVNPIRQVPRLNAQI